jgi:mitogen-activated protein kinase 1/3
MIAGKMQNTSIDVYLALELCEAGDLHAFKGQMSPSLIQRLLAQILSGVQYLHELSVWHRDLKSANVLMTMHEGMQIAKIADLGGPHPLYRET